MMSKKSSRSPGLWFATFLVVSASYFVTCALFLFGQNLTDLLVLWGDRQQISVYLKENRTDQQLEQLRARLSEDKRLESSDFVDRNRALTQFQSQMASYAPDLLKDADLMKFIPESFQVKLKSSIGKALQVETIKKLAEDLSIEPSVESVSYGQEWIKTYAGLISGIQKASFWICILILVASGFVIANSISFSIRNRSREIEVLELVGASRWMIRKPFLIEGTLLSFFAALAAQGALLGVFAAAQNFVRSEVSILGIADNMAYLSIVQVAAMVALAAVFGAMCSWICLSRLNTGWAASRSGSAA